MRIISGSARGRKLAVFDGKQIRPTPDRVREALFSMFSSRFGSLHGIRVLDLFAGTGALSLEALSRGAAAAVVVDQSPYAINLIRENTDRCGFSDKVTVIAGEVLVSLDKLLPSDPFDLILLDPPYASELASEVITRIETLNLLADGGIICAETSRQETLESQGGLSLLENRIYGSTRIHLFSCSEE